MIDSYQSQSHRQDLQSQNAQEEHLEVVQCVEEAEVAEVDSLLEEHPEEGVDSAQVVVRLEEEAALVAVVEASALDAVHREAAAVVEASAEVERCYKCIRSGMAFWSTGWSGQAVEKGQGMLPLLDLS